jgi:hypothetical protein
MLVSNSRTASKLRSDVRHAAKGQAISKKGNAAMAIVIWTGVDCLRSQCLIMLRVLGMHHCTTHVCHIMP